MKTNDTITSENIRKFRKDFSKHVSDFSDMGISDFEYSYENLRVFVEFDFCLREVRIKETSVLNDDYETIHSEDALGIRNFVSEIISDYNSKLERWEVREQEAADEKEHYNHIVFGHYY